MILTRTKNINFKDCYLDALESTQLYFNNVNAYLECHPKYSFVTIRDSVGKVLSLFSMAGKVTK